MAWKNLSSELDELFRDLSGRQPEVQNVLDRLAAQRREAVREYERQRHRRTYVKRTHLKKRMERTRDAVRDLLLAGHTGRRIALALGITQQTVSVYRKQLGLGRDQKTGRKLLKEIPYARRKPLPAEHYHPKLVGPVLAEFMAALPTCNDKELAERFGITRQAVSARRRKAARPSPAGASRRPDRAEHRDRSAA